MRRIERALISVYDKTGVVEFARGLAALKVEIISTGGTSRLLASNGIPVREVSDLTGFPEILDGRVKTINPRIAGGLLATIDHRLGGLLGEDLERVRTSRRSWLRVDPG